MNRYFYYRLSHSGCLAASLTLNPSNDTNSIASIALDEIFDI